MGRKKMMLMRLKESKRKKIKMMACLIEKTMVNKR